LGKTFIQVVEGPSFPQAHPPISTPFSSHRHLCGISPQISVIVALSHGHS
jgi:hypothetical protein